jgi:hypothetical protein
VGSPHTHPRAIPTSTDWITLSLAFTNYSCWYTYTGWSKILCAPDDYDTESFLAQSDCLTADRQGQGDTRLILTPSVIPNSNYAIMVSDWNCLKYFCVFFFTVIIRCTETFWSPCMCIYIYICIWAHLYIYMYIYICLYTSVSTCLSYTTFFLDPQLFKVNAVYPLGKPGYTHRHRVAFQKAWIVNLHAFCYWIQTCKLRRQIDMSSQIPTLASAFWD